MSRFDHEIAIVTGGGSGIGEATAKRLASEGAKVILVGRTKSKLEKVVSEINENLNETRAFLYVCDVTSEEEVKGLVEYVENEFGDVTVLVNSAGVLSYSMIRDMSFEEWKKIVQVNEDSVFLVSKYIGNLMKKCAESDQNKDRVIVNVASISGHKPGSLFPHYSAAKASTINLTKALAFEYGRSGIRVNSVSPGFVETPMIESSLQEEKMMKIIERKTLMRRVGKPDEIANVIAFLASKEASYVTGADLVVDGGFLLT